MLITVGSEYQVTKARVRQKTTQGGKSLKLLVLECSSRADYNVRSQFSIEVVVKDMDRETDPRHIIISGCQIECQTSRPVVVCISRKTRRGTVHFIDD